MARGVLALGAVSPQLDRGEAIDPNLYATPLTARSVVQAQSPPSTYAIAAWLDGEPGSGWRVVGLTLERAFFIGTGLALAGFRGRDLAVGALAASSTVTGWIVADYSLKRRRRTGLTPWSESVAP